MHNITIDTEIVSPTLSNLHSDMLLLNNKVNQLFIKNQISIYENIEDCYITKTSTLEDVHNNMPIKSIIKTYLRGSEYPDIFPKLAKNKQNVTGVFTAIKTNEATTMFCFDAYGYSGVCHYNEYESNKISKWHIQPSGGVWKLGSDYFNNELSNILYDGIYYFYSNSFSGFPTTEPCIFSRIEISDTIRVFEVTTINTIYIKKWVSRNGTTWVSIPSVHPNNAGGGELRIGDMTIDSSGDLVMRVNASTVKKL
ncbi:hypothetical protein FAP59_09725 [Morganella morganii]|uniref:hypothetical protein n=1 Tax=Morganella morganii TaxID=582 RepID=UPI003EB9AB5C|nr:hypothetical protein [Morganella morganii]